MNGLLRTLSLLAGTVTLVHATPSLPVDQAGGGATVKPSAQPNAGAAPVWSSRRAMPTPRAGARVVMLDDKLYVLGGFPGKAALLAPQFDGFDVYDPVADSWSPKAALPQMTGNSGAAAVKGRIYLIEGKSGKVYEYNPAQGKWVTKAGMPTPRLSFGMAVANDKIYTIGGLAPDGTSRYKDSAVVEEYDPETDVWKSKASIPRPRHALAAATVGGKIYAIGGDAPHPGTYDRSIGDVAEYDPHADRWVAKRTAPGVFHYHCAVAFGGTIYVFGGPDTDLKSTAMYDPDADTWAAKTSRPTARWILGAAEAQGRIFIFGGWPDLDFTSVLGTVEAYDPAADR
jgi:N-acetylneuraminic acid mutarotase